MCVSEDTQTVYTHKYSNTGSFLAEKILNFSEVFITLESLGGEIGF